MSVGDRRRRNGGVAGTLALIALTSGRLGAEPATPPIT